jgi:hypothetical protein
MNLKLYLGIALVIMAGACRNPEPKAVAKAVHVVNDTLAGYKVADTIIYDVIIDKPNADDPWTKKCLKDLHRSMLVDSLFNMVYQGEVMAYSNETGERLTPKQVKDLESAKGFSRNDISMIQFTEAWYLNPDGCTMTKKVLSMVLGYNYYTNSGDELHKALFKIKLAN